MLPKPEKCTIGHFEVCCSLQLVVVWVMLAMLVVWLQLASCG